MKHILDLQLEPVLKPNGCFLPIQTDVSCGNVRPQETFSFTMSVWGLKREKLPLVLWLGARVKVKSRPRQVPFAIVCCRVQVL